MKSSVVVVSLAYMLLAVTSFGCTRDAGSKDADQKKAAADSELARAKGLQTKYEEQIKSAEKIAAENKAAADALNTQMATWKSEQATRDTLLIDITNRVSQEQGTLTELQSQSMSLKTNIAQEQARIQGEQLALKNERERVEADLKSMRSKADQEIADARTKSSEQISAKEAALNEQRTKLEQRIAQIDEREKTLLILQQTLKDQAEKLSAEDVRLKSLKVSLDADQLKLKEAINVTRELFQKQALGDIFDKIRADQKFVFLVRIIGYGSPTNLNYTRQRVDSLTGATSQYKSLRRLGSVGILADDTFLVETTAQEMKSTRDGVDAYLQEKNKNGESKNANSIWLVIRPIEKVRVGMKLVVNGALQKYFDGRTSTPVAEFNNIRASSSSVMGMTNLDLTKPGSYLFKSDVGAKACEVVSEECLKVLVNEGLLDSPISITVSTPDGSSDEKGTDRELMAKLFDLSIKQSVVDLKEKTLLGIKMDKFDNSSFTFDPKVLKDKFGFADRAPVIDVLSIIYSVSMVEYINPIMNHLDSMQFLFSGLIGDKKLVDLNERARGEMLIPLPIASFKPSNSSLKDLTLADFKPKTPVPPKSAKLIEMEAKYGKIADSTWMWTRNTAAGVELVKLREEYAVLTKEYDAKVLVEKQEEFETRSLINAGRLSSMRDILIGK